MSQANHAKPRLGADEVLERLHATLSLRARLITTGLMLTALLFSGAIGNLWLTEPELPLRTRIAFGLLVAIGVSWAGYFGWVLARRRTLYLDHRVAAATLAIGVCAVFTVAALTLALAVPAQAQAGFGSAATGGFMLCLAIVLRARATRERARLRARARELEELLEQ